MTRRVLRRLVALVLHVQPEVQLALAHAPREVKVVVLPPHRARLRAQSTTREPGHTSGLALFGDAGVVTAPKTIQSQIGYPESPRLTGLGLVGHAGALALP